MLMVPVRTRSRDPESSLLVLSQSLLTFSVCVSKYVSSGYCPDLSAS